MCGIAAILLFPQRRTAQEWREIKHAFTQNMISNEVRGWTASGIATVDLDGDVRLCKSPLPASRFVKTTSYARMLSGVGNQTTLILGHTRLPTKGDPSNGANNQPLQTGPVIGVHNGHIQNDDELFARFRCVRAADVDSEIIFRLIASVNPRRSNGTYLGRILRLIRYLRGPRTFLANDRRRPEHLLALKDRNPLSIHFHPAWNALVFASRYSFLRQTFGPCLNAESLAHERLMLFDARRIPELAITPSVGVRVCAQEVRNGT